jgi:hypothetical protein
MTAPETIESKAQGWLPGEERFQLAYELVKAGSTWREACTTAGVEYSIAQLRYRYRGLPSPRRVNVAPVGGRDAASRRVYERAVAGEVAATVAREEGVSYQYMIRWVRRQGWPAPQATRKLGAEIAAFIGQA